MRTPKYLINETDIEADNASLKEVAHQLSNLLNKPVIIKDENETVFESHDWQLHYKYKNFMVENFLENYNIKVETTNSEFTIFKLSNY